MAAHAKCKTGFSPKKLDGIKISAGSLATLYWIKERFKVILNARTTDEVQDVCIHKRMLY